MSAIPPSFETTPGELETEIVQVSRSGHLIHFMTTSKRRKTCLFCDNLLQSKQSAKSPKSDEHVIPEWLQKHLGISGDYIRPTRVRTDGTGIIDVRTHLMGAFKAGTVCSKCNQGWMATLEAETKPHLFSPVRFVDLPGEQYPPSA